LFSDLAGRGARPRGHLEDLMKTIILVALLAAAGCSKKGGDCDAAIAKGINNLTESVKSRGGPQLEASLAIVDKLKGALTKHCTEDKWPAEVIQCFTTVTNQKDMRGCQEKLTTEQKSKLMTDIQQVMMGAMRMPPGAGHPSTLAGSGAPPGADPAAGSAAPAPGSTEPPAAAAPAAPPAAPAAGSSAANPPAAGSGGW
jgi:hypothetical protein